MHSINLEVAPDGVDPEVHDAEVRDAIVAACVEHGVVELRYPNGTPDIARIIDGELVVVAK